MGTWASPTTSLVAAITPALPPASRNRAPAMGCSAMNSLLFLITPRMVSPLWSVRYTMMFMYWQPMFMNMLSSLAPAYPMTQPSSRDVWGNSLQRISPSWKVSLIIFPIMSEEMTTVTPGILPISHS